MTTIASVQVYVLTSDLEQPFRIWGGPATRRDSVVVRIETADGAVGWGECVCHGTQRGDTAKAFIEGVYRPLLIGRSPFEIDVLWELMYNTTRPYGGGAAVHALSGVDVALWDLQGRILGRPVHELLGGAHRSELIPYATGFYRVEGRTYPEAAVEEARRHVVDGFTSFKVKIGYGIADDLAVISAIRDAVGPDVLIAVDANCAYDAPTARRLLLEMEPLKVHFFEEPLKADDIEGYKTLRGTTGTFIATGENLFGKFDFARWISEGAVDIYQPDVCSAGGPTELRKIAAIAQAHNATVIPHVWGTGIGLAAAIQVTATLPPTARAFQFTGQPTLELDRSAHPFRESIIGDTIRLEDGVVKVPTGPGLGIDVDTDVVAEYAQTP